MGIHDRSLWHIFEQRDLNNTFIRRAFHVTVRDYDGNVINDEFGPAGPFNDSRQEAGKLIWYRPHDLMHKKYTIGDELKSNFIMKRAEDFSIDLFDNKQAYYFQRVKRQVFLPRCIRE